MGRILYTFHGTDYQTTIYAKPTDNVEVYWVADKGLTTEASGSSTVPAFSAQSTIWGLESQGYTVESIKLA